MAESPSPLLSCTMRGGVAAFEGESTWRSGLIYAAVKQWRGAEAELVHQRPQHTLVLTLSGGTTLTGNRLSGEPLYEGRDRPGCVSFVPAGAQREGWYRGADMRFATLLIDPRWLEEIEPEGASGRVPLRPFVNQRDPLLASVLGGLARELGREGRALPTLYAEQAASLAMTHLARVRGAGRKPVRGLSDAVFRRVLDCIEATPHARVSLQGLAATAGMHPAAFARHFKARTGVTPYRHLLERRLECAARWLSETPMPLVDIALHAGFSSQSHFTTAFSQRYGLSPQTYRRVRGRP